VWNYSFSLSVKKWAIMLARVYHVKRERANKDLAGKHLNGWKSSGANRSHLALHVA